MCSLSMCFLSLVFHSISLDARLVRYCFYFVCEIYLYVLRQMTEWWCSEFPSLKKLSHELKPSFPSQEENRWGKCSVVDLCCCSWSNICHPVGFTDSNTALKPFYFHLLGWDDWEYCGGQELKSSTFTAAHEETCPETPRSCGNKSCWVMGYPAWLNLASHIPTG